MKVELLVFSFSVHREEKGDEAGWANRQGAGGVLLFPDAGPLQGRWACLGLSWCRGGAGIVSGEMCGGQIERRKRS